MLSARRILPTLCAVCFMGTAALRVIQASAESTSRQDDSISNPAAEARTISVKMGSRTLRVPQGYIASMDGYRRDFDYVRLWALLPCLLPENDQNQSEFHRNSLGNVLVATLGGGETGAAGQDLLDIMKKHDNLEKMDISNKNFEWYKNNLLSLDTYVLKNHKPTFVIECVMHLQYIPFPSCSVRERIWETFC